MLRSLWINWLFPATQLIHFHSISITQCILTKTSKTIGTKTSTEKVILLMFPVDIFVPIVLYVLESGLVEFCICAVQYSTASWLKTDLHETQPDQPFVAHDHLQEQKQFIMP